MNVSCAGIEYLVCKWLVEVLVVAVDIHQYIVSIVTLEVGWACHTYAAVATECCNDVVAVL